MPQIILSESQFIEVLPLHFNIAEHYLPLSEFIETANGTKAIIENFNREFCGGKLQYQIVVLPPEKGSFRSRLGVCVIAGVGLLWTFAESDIGQGYISGLTGHEPAYWAQQAGVATRNAIQKEMQEETAASKKAAAQIMKECAKGFLEKDSDDLRKIGVSIRHRGLTRRMCFIISTAFCTPKNTARSMLTTCLSSCPVYLVSKKWRISGCLVKPGAILLSCT